MNIWENTHTKIFIYAETPNKLFFMIIVETNLWYASNFTYFWRTTRKIFFLFSWKFCRRQNSVAKCFYCLMPTFVETLFFMPNATTYARAPEHTQDYRMLNKYIIWLYTARVRMFFMRFIFAYTFLTIRLDSHSHSLSHFVCCLFFCSSHSLSSTAVKYCALVAERTWKIFFQHPPKKAPRRQRA
jgi:hypothetical protein